MSLPALPPLELSHFGLMVLYALIVSSFLALLSARSPRDRFRLFLRLFVALVGGGLILAWLMYPFPPGLPAPVP